MSLAKLFYLREALRRRTRSAREAWARRKPAPRASQFHMESLENRLLLSATPAGELLSSAALEPAALTAPVNSVSIYATDVPAYVPAGAIASDTPVAFNLNYSTAGPIDFSGQTVISFRVHFNSTELAYSTFTRNTGINEAPFFIDVLDENPVDGTVDADASTNKYVFIQYVDATNSFFPSTGSGNNLQVLTSALLGQIEFLTTANFDGSTVNIVAAPPPLPSPDGTNTARVLDTAPIVLNTFLAAGRAISINDVTIGEAAGTATFTVAVSPGVDQVSFDVSVVAGGA
ncbi:MAG: LEPR-XLL domain-containing protein, partial [Nitrospira sp.]|nr:LEPR-XLL domain-containing protein [Nitrospira sp.]